MRGPSIAARCALVFLLPIACSGQSESPPVITVIGSSGNEPNGIAVRGSRVFWTSVAWDDEAGPSGIGHLQSVAIDGGPVAIMGAAYIPYWVVVDSTHAYWTGGADAAYGSPAIFSTPLDGGATSILTTLSQGLNPIAIDDANIYWADGTSLMAMPLSGGVPTLLATSPWIIAGVAVDASSVYFTAHGYDASNTSHGAVMKVPVGGGAVTTLASSTQPNAMAIDSTRVYWIDGLPVTTVLGVSLEGGPVTTYATDIAGNPAGPIAVDGASIYWLSGTSLMRTPTTSGTSTVLADAGVATGIAVDDTSVYWATEATCAAPTGCAIVQKLTPK